MVVVVARCCPLLRGHRSQQPTPLHSTPLHFITLHSTPCHATPPFTPLWLTPFHLSSSLLADPHTCFPWSLLNIQVNYCCISLGIRTTCLKAWQLWNFYYLRSLYAEMKGIRRRRGNACGWLGGVGLAVCHNSELEFMRPLKTRDSTYSLLASPTCSAYRSFSLLGKTTLWCQCPRIGCGQHRVSVGGINRAVCWFIETEHIHEVTIIPKCRIYWVIGVTTNPRLKT